MSTRIKSLVWRLRFLRPDEERCAEAADELEKMGALLEKVALLREALQVLLEPQGHVEMAKAWARKVLEVSK